MLSEVAEGRDRTDAVQKRAADVRAAREILLTTPAISNLICVERQFQIPSIIQTLEGSHAQLERRAVGSGREEGDQSGRGYVKSVEKSGLRRHSRPRAKLPRSTA